MKILIINSILYTPQNKTIPKVESIKDTMIYNLAYAFYQHGHDVTVIAADDYKPFNKEMYPFEILFFKSNLKRIFLPSVFPLHLKLFAYLKKNKTNFNLIICSEVFSFNSLFASLISPNCTLVWHENGAHNKKMKKIPSLIWYNLIAKYLMKKVLIVPRSLRAGRFAREFKLNVTDIFVENGLDSSKLMVNKIKQKQFIIIAHLVPRKNIISILENYRLFINKYKLSDYILYIAGEGPCRKEIENYIILNKLQENIFLLGNVKHELLNKYLSESCCLLCNSLKELSMIAVVESIYVGTPVITNMIPYNSDVVKKYNLGIAKDGWSEDDIFEIVSNNSFYVDNCISYSPNLSLDATVNNFVSILNNENSDNK